MTPFVPGSSCPAEAFRVFKKFRGLNPEMLHGAASKSTDTLFVGLTAGDSLHITGAFTNNGPVVVIGDGILVFDNAQALINGDIIVWGADARLEIIGSTISSPQAYIYQRSMVVAGHGRVSIENSVLDYSGMSHNLSCRTVHM